MVNTSNQAPEKVETVQGVLVANGVSMTFNPGTSKEVVAFRDCWRRFKIEPPCRLNFEPGLMANL